MKIRNLQIQEGKENLRKEQKKMISPQNFWKLMVKRKFKDSGGITHRPRQAQGMFPVKDYVSQETMACLESANLAS